MKDLKKQKSGAAQVDTPKPPRNNAWTRTLCCTVLDVLHSALSSTWCFVSHMLVRLGWESSGTIARRLPLVRAAGSLNNGNREADDVPHRGVQHQRCAADAGGTRQPSCMPVSRLPLLSHTDPTALQVSTRAFGAIKRHLMRADQVCAQYQPPPAAASPAPPAKRSGKRISGASCWRVSLSHGFGFGQCFARCSHVMNACRMRQLLGDSSTSTRYPNPRL